MNNPTPTNDATPTNETTAAAGTPPINRRDFIAATATAGLAALASVANAQPPAPAAAAPAAGGAAAAKGGGGGGGGPGVPPQFGTLKNGIPKMKGGKKNFNKNPHPPDPQAPQKGP